MKKTAFLLSILFLSLLLCCASGEENRVTLTIGEKSISVPADTEHVDLGKMTVPYTEENYQKLFSFISSLPNLKTFDMYATDLRRKQAEILTERFPDIRFGWTFVISCTNEWHPERVPHRVRTDATAFSTLHNNSSTLHTSLDLSVLRYCKDLKALDIGHNELTNLDFLYDLPHLKVLIIADVTDPSCQGLDITPVGSLKELEYLEVFKNDVRDISCLANCENLVDLNICFNRILDLSPLYGLKKLRRLWVYNYNSHNYEDSTVSPDTVLRLKEHLPDCYIDSVSWSTLGGWREHPRYDTIYEMFFGSEYIPFTTLD